MPCRPAPDIWQMARLMDERYGADAILESLSVAEHLLEDGDSQGAARWRQIQQANLWLQAQAPVPGESVH